MSTQIEVSGRQMRTRKELSTPVGRVWSAWTTPKQIAEWWGPAGFTNEIHIMDLKPGGEWRITMFAPDGKSFPNKSEFVEIVECEKIVFKHFNPNYLATIIFSEHGKDSILDWTMEFETEELFDTVVKVFKADEGLSQNVDKLEDYLIKNLK